MFSFLLFCIPCPVLLCPVVPCTALRCPAQPCLSACRLKENDALTGVPASLLAPLRGCVQTRQSNCLSRDDCAGGRDTARTGSQPSPVPASSRNTVCASLSTQWSRSCSLPVYVYAVSPVPRLMHSLILATVGRGWYRISSTMTAAITAQGSRSNPT